MTHRMKLSAALTAFAALLPLELSAQSTASGPALGVARISLVGGEVTTKRGDSGDWVAARINQPVVEGDSVTTGPGSRAEIQLDYGNLVRLNANSEIEFAALERRKFRIRLAAGSVGYSELRNSEADVDLETPLVAVRPAQNGRYRIDLGAAETVVTVRKGAAEIASVNGLETLSSGKTMIVREGAEGPEFRLSRAEPKDDWDRWAESRDNRLNKSESYRYVSRDIYGAEVLDDYGDWRYVSGYGYSWFPRSPAAGWAPYRSGRWTWLDYYGWSWVGSEPWGWAPYHWGRWYHHASYGWGWYPGSLYRRHFWRPALVTFFGYDGFSGFNPGLGFGYGGIGWCPLGPGEIYTPWYGSGFYGGGAGRTVVVDNSVNIYNAYRNARAPNGVTVVDAQGFSQGLVNNPRTLRSAELTRATSIRGQIPIVPARGSQGRIVRAAGAAAESASTARTLRSGAARVPFDRQRAQIEGSVRAFRTLQTGTAGATARAASVSRAAASSNAAAGAGARTRGGAPAAASSGLRTASRPAAGNTAAAPAFRSPRSVGTVSTGSRLSRTQASQRSVRAASTAGAWSRFGGAAPSRSTRAAATRAGTASRAAQRPVYAPRTQSRTSVRSGSAGARTRASTFGARSTGNAGSLSAGPRVFAPRSRSRVNAAAPSASTRSRGVRTPSIPRSSAPQSRARSVYTPRAASPSVGRSSSGGWFPSTRSVSRSSSSGGYSPAPVTRSAPSPAPAPRVSSSASRVSGGVTRSSSGGGVRSRSR